MKNDRAQFLWLDSTATEGYRSGVSLHGHTLHSKECLSFLPRYVGYIPGGGLLLRANARHTDFSRAYWTPPLTPASAFRLEQEQLESIGLAPIVSLTDHDDIEAGLSLQVTHRRAETPVSVEWTLPFDGTILHLGIHNLPAKLDRAWLAALTEYTAAPVEALLPAIIHGLSDTPGVLTVLNHPFWLEEGVEAATHTAALTKFLGIYSRHLHAFELNGTRSWKENRDTIALAEDYRVPVISGGDRHAGEPAACINVTNAATFSEFAAEVRDGRSNVVFLPQYREPMATRVADATWDILRPYPEYPGRELWTDRTFYECPDGVTRPLSVVWNGGVPWLARAGAGLVELVATRGMRSALRLVLANRAGFAL
jgi:hypothetical protein